MTIVANSDWEKSIIGRVTAKTRNQDPRKFSEVLFEYVDVSSISNSNFQIVETKKIFGKDAPSRARKEILANDILFATVRPTLRRIALVPPNLDNQIASTGYCVLRPRTELIYPEFLYFYVLTDNFIQEISTLERGANYPAIRDSDLFNSVIYLPPIEEQKKIAYVLSIVQTAISQQAQIIQTTTELKKALMQKLFTEGLHGEKQKESTIGLIPESWSIVNIGSCCTVSTGTTPSTKNPTYYVGSNPFIKTNQITNSRISKSDCYVSDEAVSKYNLKVFQPGTILVAMYGQGKTRGQVSFLDIAASITQNAGAISPDSSLISEFLYYYLLSQYSRLRSSGMEGHISHLNLGFLRSFQIPIPPINEQKEISKICSIIIQKIETHNNKRNSLQDLFRTLLHQLMTAQIRVHDIDLPGFEDSPSE